MGGEHMLFDRERMDACRKDMQSLQHATRVLEKELKHLHEQMNALHVGMRVRVNYLGSVCDGKKGVVRSVSLDGFLVKLDDFLEGPIHLDWRYVEVLE